MSGQLTDEDEIFFRQIHPNFFDSGEPASNRFCPSKQDDNRMSGDRAAMVTAQQSHTNFIRSGRKSAAVFGLTVREFGAEEIACYADPLEKTETEEANPAHALADYSKHDERQQKLIAKRLKHRAMARGCLYAPTIED